MNMIKKGNFSPNKNQTELSLYFPMEVRPNPLMENLKLRSSTMKCSICHGSVTQELTTDMCYSKEYTCKECGATFVKIKDNLVLTSTEEAIIV